MKHRITFPPGTQTSGTHYFDTKRALEAFLQRMHRRGIDTSAGVIRP